MKKAKKKKTTKRSPKTVQTLNDAAAAHAETDHVDPFTDAPPPEDTTGLDVQDPPEGERAEIPPPTEPAPAKKKGKAKKDREEIGRHADGNGRLFAPTEEELRREATRAADMKAGMLIGPKNLERLRSFGFDVVLVNPDHAPLTAGIAHRGMTA